MAKYTVRVPVESFLIFETEASSPLEAKEIVGRGDGDYKGSLSPAQFREIDFSWAEDKDEWEVEERK